MRLLRIVPDDTKFDFMRFRRISFPVSAMLSIAAIALYFFHGLNFGIDFIGGTLIEVQTKAGPADLAKMRAALSGLGLGDLHPSLAGPSSHVQLEAGDRSRADAAGFDGEVRERRRKEARMVLTHVRDVAVDSFGRSSDHPLFSYTDRSHPGPP